MKNNKLYNLVIKAHKETKKIFTKDMKKDYTILMPQMAPIHFEFIESATRDSGYNVELLRDCTQHTVETGLKYVNNEALVKIQKMKKLLK